MSGDKDLMLTKKGAGQPTMVPSYMVWPSKNRFYCCGLLMTGPREDDGLRLGTWAFLVGPFVLFMWAGSADMMEELPALFIVLCSAFGSTVFFLLLTSYTDPGIIPRAEVPTKGAPNGIRRVKLDDGTTVQEIFCTTCCIYRPPGASHCKDCDNCVCDWDHHCPFVGNCIGRRNYGYFTAFLTSVSVTAATMAACCIVVTAGDEWNQHFSPSRVSVMAVAAIMVFTLFIGLILGCFTCFHVTLICSNATTKEFCKSKERSALRKNRLYRVLCACCEPSQLDLHRKVPNPEVQSAAGYSELL